MKLQLLRTDFFDDATIGELYIDDVFFCYTCEDVDKGLHNGMTLGDIKDKKEMHKTAIPYTTKEPYNVVTNIQSPKYSNFEKYKWAKVCNGYLPRLTNVVGYDGVLIHVGNTANDTSGCILVGYKKNDKTIAESTRAFTDLCTVLNKTKESITLTIFKK